jgi:hypothetical protein
MTYSAPQGDARISRLHSVALRKEIGERLRTCPDQRLVEMPSRLVMLMKRLRDEQFNVI